MNNEKIIKEAKEIVAVKNGYKSLSTDDNYSAWDVAIQMTNRKASQKDLFEQVFNEIIKITIKKRQ